MGCDPSRSPSGRPGLKDADPPAARVGVAAVAAKESRVELWRRDEVVGLTASLFEKVEPFCIKKAELSVISVSKVVGGKGTFYPAID